MSGVKLVDTRVRTSYNLATINKLQLSQVAHTNSFWSKLEVVERESEIVQE